MVFTHARKHDIGATAGDDGDPFEVDVWQFAAVDQFGLRADDLGGLLLLVAGQLVRRSRLAVMMAARSATVRLTSELAEAT